MRARSERGRRGRECLAEKEGRRGSIEEKEKEEGRGRGEGFGDHIQEGGEGEIAPDFSSF